jgi:hypothetical protein
MLAEDVSSSATSAGARRVQVVSDTSAAQLTPTELRIPAEGDAATRLLQDVAPEPAQRGSNNLPLAMHQLRLPPADSFTVGDLDGWPADLRVTLDGNVDPPPPDQTTRAFVRTRLNGVLVDMADARGASHVQRTVSLPATLLQPDNTLEVTTLSAPPGDSCQLGEPGPVAAASGPFQGTATLEWTRDGAARAKLPELAARLRGAGELVLPDGQPGPARAAARVLGMLNRWSAAPILPTLIPADTYEAPVRGDYRLAFGTPDDDSQAPFTIATRASHQTLLAGEPNRPYVMLSYQTDGSAPVLTVSTAHMTDEAMLDATFRRLSEPATFGGLDGNVVLADATSQVILDLTPTGLTTGDAPPPAWAQILSTYRWVLLVPVGILIVLFWISVYRGVGRQPPLPQHPDPRSEVTQP